LLQDDPYEGVRMHACPASTVLVDIRHVCPKVGHFPKQASLTVAASASRRGQDDDVYTGLVKATIAFAIEVDLSLAQKKQIRP
jgi:hypothetical protein